MDHRIDECFELLRIAASGLCAYDAGVRDDVRRSAAGDGADVAGGLLIDASCRAVCDRLCGHGDRICSFFWRHAGMRCDAFQGEGKLVLGWAGVIERAGRAVGIEHVAEVNALDVFFFDVLGAEETDLLLYGENDSDLAVRDVHLLHEGDAF